VHALGIILAAGEAVVLLEADKRGIVSASNSFASHWDDSIVSLWLRLDIMAGSRINDEFKNWLMKAYEMDTK
jgi:hypothetical protein